METGFILSLVIISVVAVVIKLLSPGIRTSNKTGTPQDHDYTIY